jgi:hypothetical protein
MGQRRWRRFVPTIGAAIAFTAVVVAAPDAHSAPVPATFVPAGATWRYLDTGVNQGTAWRQPGFDDSAWKVGPAELGYGDGGERTVVSYGPSASNKYTTTYFRTAFTVADAAAVQTLTVQLRRDDGAVVHLNGAEVVRSNMPSGTIDFATRAVTNIEGTAEAAYSSATVSPALLGSGLNTLAVEVHQQWSGSSDLSFDLALNATVESSPTTSSSPATTTSAVTTTSAPSTTVTTGATTTTVGGGPVTLVAPGAVWRYRDTGVAPPSSWRNPAYDDSGWPSGPAQLGYGDGDEQTIVGYGPSSTNKYITTWFRHTFAVADATRISSLALGLRRDDGAVVYLNGVEVARSNLPSGTITATTRATTWNTSETTFFAFTAPPSMLVSGSNTLAVEIHQADPTSSDTSFDLALTGTDTTAPTTTTTVPSTTTTTPPAPPASPLLVAGDIGVCGASQPAATAALIGANPGTFVAVGDIAYPDGTAADFANCYDPAFGAHKSRTRPVPGNHEYFTGTADAYFDYFGTAAATRGEGWYSYDVGTWHIVAINSNCAFIGGCGPGSPQYEWLAADLAASSTACLAAYWHHAPWASELGYGPQPALQPLLALLQAEGADAIFAGHAHNYERFARKNAAGALDAAGVRVFVVGTGGAELRGFEATLATGSEARNATAHGVLRVDLGANGYFWQFLPIAGQTYTDSGGDSC